MENKYKEEVEMYLTALVNRGFSIVETDDSEEIQPTTTIEEALEVVLSVEESTVYLEKNDTKVWLDIVLGNEPGVAISNYSCNNEIEEVSSLIYDHFNS